MSDNSVQRRAPLKHPTKIQSAPFGIVNYKLFAGRALVIERDNAESPTMVMDFAFSADCLVCLQVTVLYGWAWLNFEVNCGLNSISRTAWILKTKLNEIGNFYHTFPLVFENLKAPQMGYLSTFKYVAHYFIKFINATQLYKNDSVQ